VDTKKIRDGFEKAGLPMPTIETVEGGVRVTFRRNNVNSLQTSRDVTEITIKTQPMS